MSHDEDNEDEKNLTVEAETARARQAAAWERDPAARPVPLTDAEAAKVERFIERIESAMKAPN
jgi:hypothetical protein